MTVELHVSGIVYCFSRKDTEDLTASLCSLGVKAATYHAYLPSDQRTNVHHDWIASRTQVLFSFLQVSWYRMAAQTIVVVVCISVLKSRY